MRDPEEPIMGWEQDRATALEVCSYCTEPDVDCPDLFCGHPMPCPRHPEEIRR